VFRNKFRRVKEGLDHMKKTHFGFNFEQILLGIGLSSRKKFTNKENNA
jgi:hypothetical protein